jgi:hypothetical protein
MLSHTVTSAIVTDSAIATPGREVTLRAAAAGPIIRLNMSSAPTTGTVMDVASPITTRKYSSARRVETPRASAISGSAEVSISGRNATTIATMTATPRPAIGSTSFWLTPYTSPNSSEYVSSAYSVLMLMNSAPSPSMITSASAVTTSFRAFLPSAPMPKAPPTANTASPQITLSPSRLAPAAPANAPFGIACAAKVSPRRTAKKPVTPAITATMDAAIQVLSIRPVNTLPPPPASGAPDGAAVWRR